MAKTIKFNLICDDYPCRTLDDLREHFSVEDVLGYYNSGLLNKWLDARGYTKEKTEIEEIRRTDSREIVKELIKIFEVETDETKIDHDLYIYDYREKQSVQAECDKEQKTTEQEAAKRYLDGYTQQIQTILNHSKEMGTIKAALETIVDDYMGLFELDYTRLFKLFLNHAPMAIFAALMNSVMREYIIPVEDESNHANGVIDNQIKTLASLLNVQLEDDMPDDVKKGLADDRAHFKANQDRIIYRINQIVNDKDETKLHEALGEVLKCCKAKDNAGHWIPLWHDDRPKLMILKVDQMDRIHPSGTGPDTILQTQEINGAFLLINKPEYEGGNPDSFVYYLEV